tara:strand:- start:1276 stop:2238 length:963 start_codon:yes stop_codon:yes gene_type:complete
VPALTTAQLFETHSKYLDAADAEDEGKFREALNEVMPRMYKMGYWREMFVEHTQDASKGYISLPQDTDSIVAGLLDDDPLPTRSVWHDYKMVGTNDQDDTILSAFIDDGYAPTYRDIEIAQSYYFRLEAISDVNSSLPSSAYNVTISYKGSGTGDGFDNVTLTNSATSAIGLTPHPNVSSITKIVYNTIPDGHTIRVLADRADSDPITLADIKGGSGTVRYRRYRIGGTNSSSSAHVLLKRRWENVDGTSDLVYIPSNAILKHALLGKLSEDNADIQRATYHWGLVSQLLESDTDSFRGSAKPTLRIAPDGVGAGMSGMY